MDLGQPRVTEPFSAKLRLVMDQLNLSRVGLAREIGVDKTVVGRWVTGINEPTGHNLTRLTDIVRKRIPSFTLGLWREPISVLAEAFGVAPQRNPARMPPSDISLRPVATPATPLAPTPLAPASTLPALPDRPSIAVLPFANLSGDPEQEYFADGMVEEITTALSRIRWLYVIARNSSFTFKGQAVDLRQVGRELGVRYVLEGSVRKGGNRIRITAQLIEAETGSHLWADRFDGSLEDVFDLQDQVAVSVAGVLEPALKAAEAARSTGRPTNDLTAYDLYLRAHALLRASENQVREALALTEQAIARDPNYGPALALAAWCCHRLLYNDWTEDREADRRKGTAFGRHALEMAGDDPDTVVNAAVALAYFGEDIGAMIALVDRALTVNPGLARGWHVSSVLRLWAGQPDLTIKHAETALRLSPRARVGWTYAAIGFGHFMNRDFEDSVAQLLISIQEGPGFVLQYRFLAAAYALLGRLDQARDVVGRISAMTPVLIPDLGFIRSAAHRDLLLSGLRLAAGDLCGDPPSTTSAA
jgi:adenylate cyclase